MRRCLNDFFGYCTGEPQRTDKKESGFYADITGRIVPYMCALPHCEKDKKTCGLHKDFTQTLPVGLKLSRK
jgi:hypothetical protein